MTAIRSPSWTTSPSLTTSSARVPSVSATTGISIFIDSRITRVSPSATVSPCLATTFQTLATISARISSAIGELLLVEQSVSVIQSWIRCGRVPADRTRRLPSARETCHEQESDHGQEVSQEEGSQEELGEPRQAPQQLSWPW